MKGAEIIAEYLVRERVPYVVGLCGHGDLGLLDALYERREEIRTLSVHHESAAGLHRRRVLPDPARAAGHVHVGRARVGQPAGRARVGPHGLLGVPGHHRQRADRRSSTGRPSRRPGRHYQADTPGVLRPYVKRSFQATRADQLPLMLRQAFALMLTGRPGPVHLDVPLDVFEETSDERRCPTRPVAARHLAPVGAAAERRGRDLDLLAAAERPLIVAGYGVLNAEARRGTRRVRRRRPHPGGHLPAGQGRRSTRGRRCISARPGATAPTRPTGRPAAPT